MHRLLVALVVVLLCCTALFPTLAVEGEELSGDSVAIGNGVLTIHPVRHATFVMQWSGKTIYVDPVGGGKPFADLPKPDLVLVTHIHFDHFDPATLEAVVPAGERTVIVVPKTVAEKIPQTLRGGTELKVLANGERTETAGIAVEAVPAYNMTPGKEKFHPKGATTATCLRWAERGSTSQATPRTRPRCGHSGISTSPSCR